MVFAHDGVLTSAVAIYFFLAEIFDEVYPSNRKDESIKCFHISIPYSRTFSPLKELLQTSQKLCRLFKSIHRVYLLSTQNQGEDTFSFKYVIPRMTVSTLPSTSLGITPFLYFSKNSINLSLTDENLSLAHTLRSTRTGYC